MTDVLLTHSNHLPNDPKQLRKMQPYPPLGTLYAATALRAAGITVAVCDTTFAAPIPAFLQALEVHLPKIVVIYEDDFNFVTKMCLSHMRELGYQLAALARSRGLRVVAHGSDATDHPKEYFDAGVDYVLNGEAEQALSDLCRSLLHSQEPKAIPGLLSCTSPNGSLSVKSPKNPSWVQLPQVARDLINIEPYRRAWNEKHGYFSTNVVASRGCPYRCNWCAKPISGDKFHIRSAEDVAAEIHELSNRFGVEHIWFGDDVFALNHHWVQKFADEMERKGGPIPFKIQSRADLMTEDTVTSLQRAGCTEVWMGVESGAQKILDAMGKGLKLSAVHSARQRLLRANIRACYFLQFGYPGEGWDEICQTIQLVRNTRPDDIGVSVSYPLPGTAFFHRVQAQLGRKRNWVDSDDLCAIFVASYADEFYQALRDALHAEVNEWKTQPAFSSQTSTQPSSCQGLWDRVHELEPISQNSNAITLMPEQPRTASYSDFMPIESLMARAGES